jgi:hypothetical protein
MASTQAMCTSFKREILQGYHQLGVSAGTITLTSRTSLTAPVNDAIKVALYTNTATNGEATTAYTATNEISSANYTAGGSTITSWQNPANTGTTVYAGPTSASTVSWNNITAASIQSCLLYNDTQGDRAISVHTFTDQNITNGTFTITFPTNDATTGLIRLV